jgi:hypothetical protein
VNPTGGGGGGGGPIGAIGGTSGPMGAGATMGAAESYPPTGTIGAILE